MLTSNTPCNAKQHDKKWTQYIGYQLLCQSSFLFLCLHIVMTLHPGEHFPMKMWLGEPTLPRELDKRLMMVWPRLERWSDESTLSSLNAQEYNYFHHRLLPDWLLSGLLLFMQHVNWDMYFQWYGIVETLGSHKTNQISTQIRLIGWLLINRSSCL